MKQYYIIKTAEKYTVIDTPQSVKPYLDVLDKVFNTNQNET